MPRIESLSVLTSSEGAAYLQELYGPVVENLATGLISSEIKNKELSGDPNAGSVEAKRLVNATVNEYGTARGNGKGQAVKADPVPVKIDKDKELLEEIEEKDIAFMGIDSFVERRIANQDKRMQKSLEKAFFSEAAGAGMVFTTVLTDAVEKVEAAIQKLEVTKNEFVDGIDRMDMTVIASPAVYGALATAISKQQNASFNSASGVIESFNGARVRKSVDLPVGVEFMVIVDGAVAQPLKFKPYAPKAVDLSDAIAFGMFFYYGTAAVAPDTIVVKTTGAVALTSTAGATGKTSIAVAGGLLDGSVAYYKTAASVAEPVVGSLYSALTGFAAFVPNTDITATSTHNLVVVEVNDAGEIIRTGKVASVVVG